MWLYDDFVGNGLAAQYASAINNAVASSGFTLSGPSNVFPEPEFSANTAVDHNHALQRFHGKVTLRLSSLPKGVQAMSSRPRESSGRCLLKATASAPARDSRR